MFAVDLNAHTRLDRNAYQKLLPLLQLKGIDFIEKHFDDFQLEIEIKYI